ncbi:hypothetical protein [Listeria innocua]|uniref:hypothetical protein n=1 Tax=Listeria innocua TaxID=1642 RepID=UPI0016247CC5|nr:hypothetical protein [Listeria innocua]MBC1925539.1 hypothetical protein [Listeria innocua]
MSAEYTVAKIRELEHAISQFRQIKSELDNYQIQTLSSAGSGRWSGQRKNQYKDELENAKSHLNQAKNQVGQAISECKSQQRALAGSIDFIEHPILSAQAWEIALSY